MLSISEACHRPTPLEPVHTTSPVPADDWTVGYDTGSQLTIPILGIAVVAYISILEISTRSDPVSVKLSPLIHLVCV